MGLYRNTAIITGAAGGMGIAAARRFGSSHTLVLTDLNAERLEGVAGMLREEGYIIGGVADGDLGQADIIAKLLDLAGQHGGLGPLIHTAGLSPALAGWRPIMDVNLVATARLLAATEGHLGAASVGVLIASIAGHTGGPPAPELQDLLSEPLAEGFLDRIGARLTGAEAKDDYAMAMDAYRLSKWAVMRLCEALSAPWAAKGARIVTISPGTIWTPMGRAEAENNPAAAAVVNATPAGRWGTVMDIAEAAHFLASDAASFITGCDLRVDGGVVPALRRMMAQAPG